MKAKQLIGSIGRATCALLLAGILTACSKERHIEVHAPTGAAAVNRGAKLARGLAACGLCHGEKPLSTALLTGGRLVRDRYGEVAAPNLTSIKGGISSWSDSEIVRAIRFSIGPNDTELSLEAHAGYEWLSDNDAYQLVAYLRTIPALEKVVERREIGMIDEYTTGLMDSRRSIAGYIPDINKRHRVEYGRYLVDHVARCGLCHNTPESTFSGAEYLKGGHSPVTEYSQLPAADISPSAVDGVRGWEEQELVHYLQTGETPRGNTVNTRACPIEFYRNADPEDLVAIAKYLQTVPG